MIVRSVFLCSLCVLAAGTARLEAADEISIRGAPGANAELLKKIAGKFNVLPGNKAGQQAVTAGVLLSGTKPVYDLFSDDRGRTDVLFTVSQPAKSRDGGSPKTRLASPRVFDLGQRKLLVLVNAANHVDSLTLGELRQLLQNDGKLTGWQSLGGGGLAIRCVGEKRDRWSRQLLNDKCMAFSEIRGSVQYSGYLSTRDDFVECGSAEEVIQRVKADAGAIGFCECGNADLRGVKVLAVAPGNSRNAAVLPDRSDVQPDYPLAEMLHLWVAPNASPSTIEFCRFACGKDSAGIIEQYGLASCYSARAAVVAAGLAAVKAGSCKKPAVVGTASRIADLKAMATEFTEAGSPTCLQCVPADSDAAALGLLATARDGLIAKPPQPPSAELLLLADRPDGKAMAAYGKQWEALNPKEYVIGGRAVAVVVNKQVKADSLTMAQVRSVFTGEIDNWKLLGGADAKVKLFGVRPATGNDLSSYSAGDLADLALMETEAKDKAAGGVSPSPQPSPFKGEGEAAKAAREAKLARYAAAQAGYRDGQAAEVFYKEVAPSAKLKAVAYCKTTAEVLSAVAMDENAIGFVNYTDLLAAGGELQKNMAVKVVAIGAAGRAVGPSVDTIKNAMYPLSQRLYLYVHPQASETARDLAKFVATCGQSAANLYVDVPGSVRQTFSKLGLVSFASSITLPEMLTNQSGKPVSARVPAPVGAAAP